MFSAAASAAPGGGIDALASNMLDLFPSVSTPQQAQLKLERLLYAAQTRYAGPTQMQRSLAASLYDDAVEYMTTLEMNRAASYTFGFRNSYGQNGTTLNEIGGGTRGESVANEMWELLIDYTLGKYTQHSVMALTKTINLIQHVLLHGSENCVTDGELLYRIELVVEPLRNLNTALVEQQMVERILNNEGQATGAGNDVVLTAEGIGQQLASFGTKATATMMKLRGGSVDRGHSVRAAAGNLHGIVSVPGKLKQIRLAQSSSFQQGMQGGSLVPVGSAKQVGYITDEGRLRLLQQKMVEEERVQKQKQWQDQQRLKQTRSNLAGRSATDSFGGGYSANAPGGGGKMVVGAAHSLQDMIESAKVELEQHKSKRRQKIESMKAGFCDDPYARARQLAELETQRVESDPEFARREKALQDALEYLEEMQKLEREQAGDLLEGDLLDGGAAGGGGGGGFSGGGGATTGGHDAGGGADLLGFDVFGGAPAPSGPSDNFGGGGSSDLLGFDPTPAAGHNPVMPGYMGGGSTMGQADDFLAAPTELRPSLLTGTKGGNAATNINNDLMATMGGGMTSAPMPPRQPMPSANYSDNLSAMGALGGAPGTGALGGARGTLRPESSEEARAENSRKMGMAAGLFAGVVPDDARKANSQKKPIMAMGNDSSKLSALDDLIPVGDASLASAPTSNNSAFDAKGLNAPMPSSDPFGMGMLGGNTGNAAIPPAPAPSTAPPPPSADPFGMGSMGGSVGNSSSDPFAMGPMGGMGGIGASAMPSAPPPTAPPPPPTEPPPPAPTMAPPPPPMMPQMAPAMAAPNTAANNSMGNNQTVEQMQAMIEQQQAQMAQMMQMMQRMQMQGGGGGGPSNNGGGAGGGWP